MKRRARIVLLALAAACALPAAAQPIVGTWTGTVHQAGEPPYPAEMTLTSPTSGSSSYSSLSCGGTLSGGVSGSGSSAAYRFRESITHGRATETTGGCIDGTIEMVVQGNSMQWSWSGSWQGKSYFASATLQRASAPQASWSRGQWVRGVSVANVLGTCFTTWTCQPRSIVRSPDSGLLHADSQRTAGACQATPDNPKKCGVCLSNEPAAVCEYCVQPAECASPNLGSRTREALGCCPAR
jgi:hypothetical protein